MSLLLESIDVQQDTRLQLKNTNYQSRYKFRLSSTVEYVTRCTFMMLLLFDIGGIVAEVLHTCSICNAWLYIFISSTDGTVWLPKLRQGFVADVL